jgi:DNA-binding NtrC family response regulator
MSRLLVVDDDAHVRQFVAKLAYRRAGNALAVISASGFGEALAICAANPVDAVLSDYFMLDHDGPDLVRRLQQLHPETRAMLMTGDASRVGEQLEGLATPVRDKVNLEAIVEEAVQLALGTL